ncbi:M1 family metallopeptidase [Haloflavibacter putidus]|uniref:Aminopeptidase N n=1 Tax=Haloflavibacter putidus TaxID=2576776 RepID=A0A507ZQQ2_9FLAO|nr:M1 family metallopeptidase [Haloflavibacter putidus]TQD39277.1 M1 family metallopeptidase [Haloflavibacter putidus]
MKYFFCCCFALLTQILPAQQLDKVDFLQLNAALEIFPEKELIQGDVELNFKILEATDSIYVDAKNMQATLQKGSTFDATLHLAKDKIWILGNFKKNKTYTLHFSYSVQPKQTMYFLGWDSGGSKQVWTQGQGKYTSHWLPSIDDVNDKLIFSIDYKIPKKLKLAANGKLVDTLVTANKKLWRYQMQKPMSSYLVAMAFGNYAYKTIEAENGTPLKLYYEPKDSLKVEPTYRYTKEIFDFLEAEIGVDYPWQNNKQVPVRDFLYAGMENTSLTIFSESFVTDSIGFIDRNYVNVNAHELAHQWFGNLVTETSSTHHWLQEGFATYYALLAEREIFGDDYFYYKLYQSAEQLRALSESGKGEALLNPKASSLTFYQKGAWALHILKEKIGKEAFTEAIRAYLKKYAYKNVTTDNFFTEVEKVSQTDLTEFKKNWMLQSAFQAREALESLKKSSFMREYLDLAALRTKTLESKRIDLQKALSFPVNDYLGQEAVYQLASENTASVINLYKKAFASNNILVRQAIALRSNKIPKNLQTQYESLLEDASYLTKEKALLSLWQNFPRKRHEYLDKMRGIEGFRNKNIELLWLTLNLATPDYEPAKQQDYYNKLSGYTAPKYDYAVRENAFGYLYQINLFSVKNYKDLLQGTTHEVWRFRKFCRQLLAQLLSEQEHRAEIQALANDLPAKQQKYLEKQL